MITGFDAFGRNQFNPSEALVDCLPEQVDAGKAKLLLAGAVLPTCCQGSWKALRRAITREQPDVLIMAGLAQKRDRLSLERFALNVRDYRIPDNEGHIWDGDPIDARGEHALKTGVALQKLQAHLKKAGFPSEISNHAGSYVCNDVYYHALSYQQNHAKPAVVLFVHLPLPGRWAKTIAAESSKFRRRALSSRAAQIALLRDGVLEIARFCAAVIH